MVPSYIFLLSCLVYGVAAGGSVGGRPTASAPAGSPRGAVSSPGPSYLPPTKGVVGGHSSSQTVGPVAPAPTVQRPISSGTQGKRVRGGRPAAQSIASAAPAPSVQRAIPSGSPAKRVGGIRPAGQPARSVVSKPTGQRLTASDAALKPISFPGVNSGRPISSGHKQSGNKAGASVHSSSRTVGSHAPY